MILTCLLEPCVEVLDFFMSFKTYIRKVIKLKTKSKKLISLLLAAITVSTLFSVSLTANAAENGKVKVTVKNDVYSVSDGAKWDGTLVDEWVEIDDSSTMMSLLVSALESNGYTQTGADNNYITEINGLSAGDAGYMSGWMSTVNDWFANEGCDAFSVANGTLESGDELTFIYSNAWGADVGSIWDSFDTSLAGISFDNGVLSEEFDPSKYEYTLTLDSEMPVTVTPCAANKNYQVRTYKNEYTPLVDGSEYKRSQAVSVQDGDKLIVAVGDPAWPSMNTSDGASVYTFNISVKDTVAEAMNNASSYLLALGASKVGVYGSEWSVMGLARDERITDEIKDAYYESIESYVEQNKSSKLSTSKSTENSRVIIALSSIGKDASKVSGYNLIEPLADFDYVKKQGINGPVFALIALDTYGYEIPAAPEGTAQTTREGLIEYILSSPVESGGWTLFGSTADPDMTGMAIQALAPYYNSDSDVKTAVDKALNAMSNNQADNGGFSSWGTVNVESCAQMLTALTSLKINPTTDERFIKNGKTVIDAIMEFRAENGFAHTKGGSYNQMATEQAYYALVSYYRLCTGKTSLYDMSDKKELIYDIDGDGVLSIKDSTLIQKYAVGMAGLTEDQLEKADCNNDSTVNILDATMLQKLLVK